MGATKTTIRVVPALLACLLCSCTTYVMNGAFTSSGHPDAPVVQKATEVMHNTRVRVTVSPTIRDTVATVRVHAGEPGAIGPEVFSVNPVAAVATTSKYLNSLTNCTHSNNPCHDVHVNIIGLAWLPGVFSNEGFPFPDTEIGITANVRGADGSDVRRECVVSGSGPSHFGMFMSNKILSSSFQSSLRNAFGMALVCVLTPALIFNRSGRFQSYFKSHAFTF